jgi:LPXTG-motif cell wall-anchored protein
MITIDSSLLTGLAALVTSLSGLVWAFRRKR